MNDQTNLQQFRAHQAVMDVLNGVAIYADLRQWDQLRQLYADEVNIDYTSQNGGKPNTIKGDDLIAN
jgi:hypothetical protein